MEFVGSESGQSLQLIHMDEVRPLRGGAFFPDVAARLVERYRLQSVAPRTEPNQPAKFLEGVAVLEGLTVPITSLEIYADGILVNARNTEDADAVLSDVIDWGFKNLDARQPKSWLPRKYISRVIVDFEQSSGDLFFKKFRTLLRIVEDSLGSDHTLDLQFQFGPNPPGELPYMHTWVLQPRAGQPPAPNRYFSIAPISTPAHLDMLRKLEAAALR